MAAGSQLTPVVTDSVAQVSTTDIPVGSMITRNRTWAHDVLYINSIARVQHV